MRKREEIYKNMGGKVFPLGFGIIIEVLLDIRDLLTKENK